ncbi:replication factor C large subunit [Candidatus Woesearchaeota archaeon]|nr:replication factor C large subunit [Candidatus Woesearchaeota archaeon]
MEPWVRKYQPRAFSEISGQEKAVKAIKDFITNFKKQKKKAILLYGPSGSGKTCSAVAAASELDMELLEVNASDKRNKDAINAVVGQSLKQQSLFAKPKLLLLDEVDGLSGRDDRGGIAAVVPLIKESKFPIILTANDAYIDKLKALRKVCTLVEFERLDATTMFNIMKKICDAENVKYDEDALKRLAYKADGDLRGALTDLETLCRNTKSLEKDNIMAVSDRDKKDSLQNALIKVFKGSDIKVAEGAFKNIDDNLDEVMLWVEENLPSEYSGDSLARAFDAVSKADVYRGRIRRWQHWRFLVYVDALLSAGVAAAKDKKNPKMIEYKRSSRILKMWIAKQKLAKRKAIAAKLAQHTHTSTKRAFEEVMFLKPIFKNNKGDAIAEQLDLDPEEIEWLER